MVIEINMDLLLSPSEVAAWNAIRADIKDMPHNKAEIRSIVKSEFEDQFSDGGTDPRTGASGYWRITRNPSKKYLEAKRKGGFGDQPLVRTGQLKKSIMGFSFGWLKGGLLSIRWKDKRAKFEAPKVTTTKKQKRMQSRYRRGLNVNLEFLSNKQIDLAEFYQKTGCGMYATPSLTKAIFGENGYVMRLYRKLGERIDRSA